MEKPVRFLIADGSSEDPERDRGLKENIARAKRTALDLGAEMIHARLCEYRFKLKTACRGSKSISKNLRPLADLVHNCDVLIIATATHWSSDALWCKLFVDQVLSPKEEGGLGPGFEYWGKTAGLLLICDDDGASMLSARLLHMLTHMGFSVPAWASHYMNVSIPSGETENNWQRCPELIVPILNWHAKKMRDIPSYQHFVKQAKKQK